MRNKYINKLSLLVLCIVILLTSSSCEANKSEDNFDIEVAYERGIEDGKYQSFLNLFDAAFTADTEVVLAANEIWKTKYFDLELSDLKIDNNYYLYYNITLKGETIDDCCRRGGLFFSVYCIEDESWVKVLQGRDYHFYADYIQENTARGTARIDNDFPSLLPVIIIYEGHLFCAMYNVFVY